MSVVVVEIADDMHFADGPGEACVATHEVPHGFVVVRITVRLGEPEEFVEVLPGRTDLRVGELPGLGNADAEAPEIDRKRSVVIGPDVVGQGYVLLPDRLIAARATRGEDRNECEREAAQNSGFHRRTSV